MKYVTLLTDFGLRDGYTAVMKGVIWSIAPDAQVADITHSVSPQNVLEGALTLARCLPYFPAGTVHIAVVDPGVGTGRRPIAAQLGSHFFVGPDNGLATFIIQQAKEWGGELQIVHLNRPEYWLDSVSTVFHGRDIFAPVGAHIVNGVPLDRLGATIQDPVLLKISPPQRVDGGWQGEVIHIDSFGNLATNLVREQFNSDPQTVCVEIGGQTIQGLVQAFGERPPGELVALFDSSGYLSIAVVNGDAAKRIGARVGSQVLVKT